MPRLVNPATNPNGYMAAAGAILAAVVMITNAVHHHGIIDPTVIVSAIGAMAALFTRQLVTPVGDPKDGNGNALRLVPEGSVIVPAASVAPPAAQEGK